MAPMTATFPTSYEATTRLCSKYELDDPMPAVCRTWHSFETTRIRGERELNAAVAEFQLSRQQEDPLTQSKRELDAEIIRFNSDMKEVLAQASLHEAVAWAGGCAKFSAQQAAAVQHVISSRQVLSDRVADVARRVDVLNQAEANGVLRLDDVDKLRQFVEALRHRASDLLAALTGSGLTLRGLAQQAPMGGSGAAPRILNPVPKPPAQCSTFTGMAFTPLPDLPMLTGAPGSGSWAELRDQFSRLNQLTQETHDRLEKPGNGEEKSPVQLLKDRLTQFNSLVIQHSGRDYLDALERVDLQIREAALRRNALAKQFLDSGGDDLSLLNEAVSASREVTNLYLGAKAALLDLASLAIERAISNAATPGLQKPVPVPEQLWVFRAGQRNSPLLPPYESLEQVLKGEQLTAFKSFRSVPLEKAQGLCKVYKITLGYFNLERGFEPRPLPGDPLQPNLPNLVCVETY
jgi:hypothetical protein